MGAWRYVEETEQREAERRQELEEKAVTRVLLMCNETLQQGRDNRKDRGIEGGRQGGKKERKNVAVREREKDEWVNKRKPSRRRA